MASAPNTCVRLNTGDEIPAVGLGVFLSRPGQETYKACREALACGYRHIDTAQLYENEADVGKAVRDSKLPRESVWITSKIWSSAWGYNSTKAAAEDSLRLMKFNHVDLMLLHSPGDPRLRAETWRALEDLQKQGKIRAIGVSNFGIGHLDKLMQTARIKPAVNQMELSPFLQRAELVSYCQKHDIALEAYSPLVKAQKLKNSTLQTLAQETGRTPAQILVRWSLQKGFIPLPKSVHSDRIRANLDVFNFHLSPDQMSSLDQLESNYITAWDPANSDPI